VERGRGREGGRERETEERESDGEEVHSRSLFFLIPRPVLLKKTV